MVKTRGRKVGRILIYAAILIITYLLQASVFDRVKLFGVCPLLLPTVTVGVAMFAGSIRGGVFGLLAGMLCDLSLGQTMIVFTLFLTLTGVVLGLLFESVLARGFPSYAICCVVILALAAGVQALELLLFAGASKQALIDVGLRQTLYSIIFVLPLYYPCRLVSRT